MGQHDTYLKSPCITRLLGVITILLTLQTIFVSVIIYGVYNVYDTHKHDLKAIGKVPWGDMAQKITDQYMSMDVNTFNDILKDSKNATHKANLFLHSDVEQTMQDIDVITKKSLHTLESIQAPIKQITAVLSTDNSEHITDIIGLLRSISSRMDQLNIEKFVNTLVFIANILKENTSKENIKHIYSIIYKMDSIMTKKNNKLVHDIVEDTDHTIRSVHKILDVFQEHH